MKTRLNRQLKDIRTILGNLSEDPKYLADKLSVLYEDVAKSNEYAKVQREWVITAFFSALAGKVTAPRQASEISLTDLAAVASEEDRWERRKGQMYWTEPNLKRTFEKLFRNAGSPQIRIKPKAESRNEGRNDGAIRVRVEPVGSLLPADQQRGINGAETASPRRVQVRSVEAARPVRARQVEGDVEVVDDEPNSANTTIAVNSSDMTESQRMELSQNGAANIDVPENAISMLDARTLEEFYVRRIESAMGSRAGGGVYDSVAKKALVVNPRNCTPLHRDNTATIIQKMKSLQIYDRELLDLIPIERTFEYHIHKSGFFGRGELRVIVAAITVSPVQEFLEQRYGEAPLTGADIERAIADLVLDPNKSYYVGIFSTTGWTAKAREYASAAKNLELHLIEKSADGGWRVTCAQCVDEEPLLDTLFDPETDVEKIDRIKLYIKNLKALSIRGGHVVLANVCEDLSMPISTVRTAMELMVEEDGELSITEAAGLEILKRKRF